MIYGTFGLLFVVYFELIGRWIAYKLKIEKMQFYFAIGFFSFLGIAFLTTSILTSNNCSFYLVFVIYALMLLTALLFTIKDFKNIDHHVNYKYLAISTIIVIILLYYSYNTTLGDPNGFDTVFYTNFITNNIGNSVLNSKDVYLNGLPQIKMTYYNCQTYYYAISCLLFVLGKFSTLLHIEFYNLPAIFWIMQIVFDTLLANIIIESYDIYKNKNKPFLLAVGFVLVFVFGKFYYNSAFGFFGNSMRILSVSYATLFIYKYFKNNNIYEKYLFYICLLACCSLTTTGGFIMAFYLMGLYFVLVDKDDNLLKEYAIVFAVPLYMMCNMEYQTMPYRYFLPLAMIVLAFLLNNVITKLMRYKKSKYIFLIILISLMFLLSRITTGSFVDFSAFFNNKGSTIDMVQPYFNITKEFNIFNLYKVFVLLILFTGLIINRKNRLGMLFIVLILILFNPLCCSFINSIIDLYYRAYEIIINPFTLMMFAASISELINNKYVNICVSILIVFIFSIKIDFLNPVYWHYSFDPNEGYAYEYRNKEKYNHINKMSENEFDIIKQLKNNIGYFGENNPYIITGNLFTQTMLPQGKYLYGREYKKREYWTESEKQLYEIFYPVTYWGENNKIFADYDNMKKYIDEVGINYIVIDKDIDYYDTEQGVWYSLMLKVNKECGIYPIYENDRYALYHFEY